MFGRLHKILLTTTALVPLGFAPAGANPQGAQVVGGAATVQGQGTTSVVVQQSTDKAIINWNSFNIGANEKTQFIQPNSSSIALNRVTGGLGPSQIYGALSANGRIFVVNPDGILIGPGAKIDTAGFLATTHDIANADFMAGRYNFSIPGNPSASVVNEGTITAQTGGFAALVAPGVRNSGTITARLGDITLASGNAFSLDFYGDKLITLGVSDSIAAQVKDVSTGQPLASLVSNAGKLKANGGTVELTAVAARQVVDSVINNTGVIEANSIGSHNGMIVLSAATATSKPVDAPTQTVKVSGKLLAAGKKKGTKGGTIEVTGEAIAVTGATLNASGRSGGGTVLIGGDVGGGNPNPAVAGIPQAQLQPYAVPTASTVTVDAATTINASAKDTGDGGKVVVWADQFTSFAGLINATGGTLGGNGGFVETSGHALDFAGARVDTTAPNGLTGSWLLDPYDLTIDAGAAATIATSLATTDVTIQTTATGSSGSGIVNPSGNGDIFVNSDISWNSANSLTLSAYRNIAVNASIANNGSGNVTLRADNTGTGFGTASIGSGKTISTAGAVLIFYNPSVNPAGSVVNPTSYLNPTENFVGITAGGGFTAYMLVNTTYDLQNIQNNLTGTYALGKDLSANTTANWNSGTGFVPIGNDPTGLNSFAGILDGQSHRIDGLVINNPLSNPSVGYGLFSRVGSSGVVRNVGLTNVSVTINSGGAAGLVGINHGLVDNSYVLGSISVTNGSAGGLVGTNMDTGIITRSYSTAAVSGGQDSIVGGLVAVNNPGGTISQSYATGPVSTGNNGIAGGLVGYNLFSNIAGVILTGTVANSYALGTVTVTNSTISGDVGGLVGDNNGGSVTNSYATGQITGGLNSSAGGLVGRINAGTVTNSYWDAYTTGQQSPCGIGSCSGANAVTSDPGQSAASNYAYKQSAYLGFDFSTDWFSIDSNTRPFLRSEYSTTITNAHQLQLVTMNLSANYTLAKNIDLGPALASDSNGNYSGMWGAAGFVPIGNFVDRFNGVFDGQGRVISNITINAAASYAGLFGYIDGGKIENVGLLGGSVIGNSYVGALVGYNDRGTIEQSYASATVAGSFGAVGGLVGYNTGTINESYSTGVVSGDGAGGLVGINGLPGTGFGTISSSYATGAVNGDSSGGLVGTNYGTVTTSYASGAVTGSSDLGGFASVNYGTITQSFATGNVTGSASSGRPAGGFAGENLGGHIEQSYATGAVTGGNSVGGLVGVNFGDISQSYSTGAVNAGVNPGGLAGTAFGNFNGNPGSVSTSYWDVDASGQSGSFGGTGFTTAQLKSALPTGFDPTVWAISASVNSGYPYLQWQAPPATPTSSPPPTPIALPPGTPPTDTGQTKDYSQAVGPIFAILNNPTDLGLIKFVNFSEDLTKGQVAGEIAIGTAGLIACALGGCEAAGVAMTVTGVGLMIVDLLKIESSAFKGNMDQAEQQSLEFIIGTAIP